MTDDDDNLDNLDELDIPDGMEDAEQAVEVFRAWVADGNLHVIFNPGTFEDVGDWGRLLADCAQHLATAAALDGQLDADAAMARIRQGFEKALAPAPDPDAPKGLRSGHIKRTRHH